MAGALEMAGEIAGRSPVAVQGTKINLIYSRDHSVAEGLDYMVRTTLSSSDVSVSQWSCLYLMQLFNMEYLVFSRLTGT